MVIIVHIIAALVSLILATITSMRPSLRRIKLAAGLVLLTISSGTYLVLKLHTNILEVCLSGLIYILFVSTGLAIGYHKLLAGRD